MSNLRDIRQNELFFSNFISWSLESAEEYVDKNRKFGRRHAAIKRLAESYFGDYIRVLSARYSRGDSMQVLKLELPAMLERFRRTIERGREIAAMDPVSESDFQGKIEPYKHLIDISRGRAPDLHSTYSIIAWLVCLGAKQEDIAEIAGFFEAGVDALVDRLFLPYAPSRQQAENVICPKHFSLLYEAIDAPKDQQAKLIKKYLKNWRKYLDDVNSFGTRVFPGCETRDSYVGFWALEVSAVVKVFDIDDSSFIDNEYYPADLVHGVDGVTA